jgi:predicted acylesterase/phospholipase RssA
VVRKAAATGRVRLKKESSLINVANDVSMRHPQRGIRGVPSLDLIDRHTRPPPLDDLAQRGDSDLTIGLTLSGGGTRAMAFHLGCMRALHEVGILQR